MLRQMQDVTPAERDTRPLDSMGSSGSRDLEQTAPNECTVEAIDPQVEAQIGRFLRAAYQADLSGPAPSRFIELLRQLETIEPPESP